MESVAKMAEFIIKAREDEEPIARNAGYPELVRCKDCKHRDPKDHKCDHHWNAYSPIPVDDDFWCGYGEK